MDKNDPLTRKTPSPSGQPSGGASSTGNTPGSFSEILEGLETLLRNLDGREEDLRLTYRLKKRFLEIENEWQKLSVESARLSEVLEKVTKPAFRIGTCLGRTDDGLAWVSVGGGDYQAAVDPRVDITTLRKGERVRLNEALSVLGTLGPDISGPVVRVSRELPDGRVEVGSDRPDSQLGTVLDRSEALEGQSLSAGDLVRLDSTSRVIVEKVRKREEGYLLAEIPKMGWESIGGQKEAIAEIKKAILNPLLYPESYSRYDFRSPRGFLLYGPPGCGKTLIGKATAREIAQRLSQKKGTDLKGVFFHIKGPEILNMWLGESERIVRELFEEGEKIRAAGDFPVLFIDEAEAILGTRRSGRGFNIHNTIVPMFCALLDGLEGPGGFEMVILATNRPEMIDPAILRPGRIDRKIKVVRPSFDAALEILGIHLGESVPVDFSAGGREALLRTFRDRLFERSDANVVFEVLRRSGARTPIYRSDLSSGAILGSIVQRAKEKALLREIEEGKGGGVTLEDLLWALDNEYEEGDILPPPDAAVDWMGLLDMETNDVVDVRRVRRLSSGARIPRAIE
uniref:AAA ATPase, central domain protein n=1 Tax=Leptospirillum ferrodiazotrophum TaxID=412449 RepID=C6HUF1_9BACT|nr:MAG: AAA ATPase, central domain protein [Leptospirillum ferrodiazotrophum]